MIVGNTVRYRLAHVVRTTVRAGEMLPRHWVDIIRYVTGDVTPVLQMREGVAQKVLDFYEVEERKQMRLN